MKEYRFFFLFSEQLNYSPVAQSITFVFINFDALATEELHVVCKL